jgi:signal transduction histidine kinase
MHDFNNVLTTILGYTEFLLLDESLEEESREYVQEIRDSADRGSDLIRQVLLCCKRQSGVREALNLNEVICDIENMLIRLAGDDVILIKVLTSDLHSVLCDACHIQQVLMNLVCNARDAIQGDGKIIVETSNLDLREDVGDIEAGRYVLLSVSDTGMGMEDCIRDRFLSPAGETTEEEDGTVTGLSTVFDTVTRIGWSLRVQSEPGKGTTVRIYVPVLGG